MNSQESLTEQLKRLIGHAHTEGLYDAADYLAQLLKGDGKTSGPPKVQMPANRVAVLGAAMRALVEVKTADWEASSPDRAGFLPTELRVKVREVVDRWEEVKPKAGE